MLVDDGFHANAFSIGWRRNGRVDLGIDGMEGIVGGAKDRRIVDRVLSFRLRLDVCRGKAMGGVTFGNTYDKR